MLFLVFVAQLLGGAEAFIPALLGQQVTQQFDAPKKASSRRYLASLKAASESPEPQDPTIGRRVLLENTSCFVATFLLGPKRSEVRWSTIVVLQSLGSLSPVDIKRHVHVATILSSFISST